MTRATIAGAGAIAIFAACVAVSCASDLSLTKKATAVKRGDPSARALQLLGTPDDRQSEEDDEVLQYCAVPTPAVAGDSSEFVVVWLSKDTVTGVTSYRRAFTIGNPCVSAFKAIHWEDAPARVIAPHNP